MIKATFLQATAWLLDLRIAMGINESSKEARLAVRPIAASLIKDYGADVFRPESREHVAATLKWFREPDIRERLTAWCEANEIATRPTVIGTISDWLFETILEKEGGHPGPMMTSWLATKGRFPPWP
jgi:hypothetical protein